MILYHGSFLEIKNPDLVHSRPTVDFGRGFYVTVIANLFTWVICQCSFVELYFVKVVNIIITIHMVRCVLCFIKSWA